MTAQIIPVAFASIFVAGCLVIRALQRWSDLVLGGLAWVFTAVVLLLLAEIAANHLPRSAPAATGQPLQATRDAAGAGGPNPNGPTEMRAPYADRATIAVQD
jgi:hypothetical protein